MIRRLFLKLKMWRMKAQADSLRQEAWLAFALAADYHATGQAMIDRAKMLETKRRIMLMGVL